MAAYLCRIFWGHVYLSGAVASSCSRWAMAANLRSFLSCGKWIILMTHIHLMNITGQP